MADTLGSLIDKLFTADTKMWNNQEVLYEMRRLSFEEFKEKLIYITENHDKYYKNIKNNFNYYNKNTFKRYEEIIKRCIQ